MASAISHDGMYVTYDNYARMNKESEEHHEKIRNLVNRSKEVNQMVADLKVCLDS
jgi:hypothetical protein